jgi:SAM-dependent methyltransferase
MTTWDEAFAEHYDEWASGMKADVAFYVELASEAPPGAIVELAVGDGRVAIPVAQATRRRVIGIDLSPAMLQRATERAHAAAVELDLQQTSMTDFVLDEPAALVYCPYGALLHLPTWAARRETFERVAGALAPSGRFAWNALAFDHQLAVEADGGRGTRPVPYTTRFYVGDNRIEITLDDGSKSTVWWATKNEWLGLIDVAGLEVEALYGGFDRTPFDPQSRQYVFVTRPRRH